MKAPFEFRMVDAVGATATMFYDPWQSWLRDADGRDLLAGLRQPRRFDPVSAVSPGTPAGKSRAPTRLKIQLGLGCNYECAYCVQSAFVKGAATTSTHDADAFMAKLEARLSLDAVRQVEVWGGEPLLYRRKLDVIVPRIRSRLPEAKILMITNGALLNAEVVDWIAAHEISVAVSHDGPGQALRGPDPFENPIVLEAVRRLQRERGDRFSINSVLTAENHDIDAIRGWMRERIAPDVTWNLEGIVHVYGAAPRPWTDEQYRTLRLSVLEQFLTGEAMRILSIRQTVEDFVDSLTCERPASALWQSCGMDKPEQLAVDLAGNVLTCQNVGAGDGHKIGHLDALEAAHLTTSTHWAHREECNHCPVVQLCKGACMFQHGAAFAASCENEYHYKLAIFQGAIFMLTGFVPLEVYGDIRRPRHARTIPIRALPGGANAGHVNLEEPC